MSWSRGYERSSWIVWWALWGFLVFRQRLYVIHGSSTTQHGQIRNVEGHQTREGNATVPELPSGAGARGKNFGVEDGHTE